MYKGVKKPLFKEHKNAIIRMQDKTVITGYMIFQSNTKIIFEKVQKKLSYKYKTNIYWHPRRNSKSKAGDVTVLWLLNEKNKQ